MIMHLDVIEQNDYKRWDDLVSNSNNGTTYHKWNWLKVVEKHSGSKLLPLIFYDANDDKPFAAIPLFYRNLYGVKMVFSPPPGSAVTLGPIFIDKGYKQHKYELAYLEFQSSIDKFIKRLHADYISIMTSAGLIDIRPFQWAGYEVIPTYTYKIDLNKDKDVLRAGLSDSLKKHINRGIKKGLKFSDQRGSEGIEAIYEALKRRYSDQKIQLPLGKKYLLDLYEVFGNTCMKTYSVLHDNEIVSGVICIVNPDNTLSEWVGSYRSSGLYDEANEVLRWGCICKAKEKGFRWFEIIGANTPNLCYAKSQFNPKIDILFQIKKSNLKGKIAERGYMFMMKQPFKIKIL